jgi:hypothetical protein
MTTSTKTSTPPIQPPEGHDPLSPAPMTTTTKMSKPPCQPPEGHDPLSPARMMTPRVTTVRPRK